MLKSVKETCASRHLAAIQLSKCCKFSKPGKWFEVTLLQSKLHRFSITVKVHFTGLQERDEISLLKQRGSPFHSSPCSSARAFQTSTSPETMKYTKFFAAWNSSPSFQICKVMKYIHSMYSIILDISILCTFCMLRSSLKVRLLNRPAGWFHQAWSFCPPESQTSLQIVWRSVASDSLSKVSKKTRTKPGARSGHGPKELGHPGQNRFSGPMNQRNLKP